MSRLLFWISCMSVCVLLTGCQDDHNLVKEPDTGYIDADGYPVGTPYWWRSHPFFRDKNVDEAATLATGDPYLVFLEDEPVAEHRKFIDALNDQYSEEQILHL